MIISLNKTESELAKELTNIALANAAASFSKMLKERVTFICEDNPIKQFKLKNGLNIQEHLYILLTEYVGDISAETYLIIYPEHANTIAQTMLPKADLANQLKDAILLETDNILAAAVATKYSDILGHSITGDVPKMIRKSLPETQSFINTKLQEQNSFYCFSTHFLADKLGLDAHFICAFHPNFGQAIRAVSQQQDTLALIGEKEKEAKEYLRDV